MLKGFKDFVMRGNIVDLAIAVVIGVAFGAVVNAFVTAVVKPMIAAMPGASANGLGFSLRGGALEKSTFVDLSAVLNAAIVFVLTAAVVYFVFVLPMAKLTAKRTDQNAEAVAVPTDTALLTEIRDLLTVTRFSATEVALGAKHRT